ncbi:MAG: hypothetical protein J6S85_18805 [Methanobrevibacter sp.]|nr:hypothetical protein [Methanobrevibacter sp.]
MAKMTISGLQSAMASYVAAAKQAGAWSASTNNFVGLLDKIGKQVTIDGGFYDKLPELDGDELPLGKTIEEWFIDLTLPTAYSDVTTDGADDIVPALPSVEDVSYCYSLGRQKVKTTVPFDNFERAMINAQESANLGAKILERLNNSYELTKYAIKKQLIGNAIDKAVTAGSYANVALPVDTSTGEALIKQLKKDIEAAQFAHMGNCLAGSSCLIGGSPELILYMKKGVMPELEVDTFAGAFNREDLAVPCRIKVVDDFGTLTNSGAFAVLVDPRGIKTHNGYNALRSKENADGDFINFVRHFEVTGFISKYAYIKVYKPAA